MNKENRGSLPSWLMWHHNQEVATHYIIGYLNTPIPKEDVFKEKTLGDIYSENFTDVEAFKINAAKLFEKKINDANIWGFRVKCTIEDTKEEDLVELQVFTLYVLNEDTGEVIISPYYITVQDNTITINQEL